MLWPLSQVYTNWNHIRISILNKLVGWSRSILFKTSHIWQSIGLIYLLVPRASVVCTFLLLCRLFLPPIVFLWTFCRHIQDMEGRFREEITFRHLTESQSAMQSIRANKSHDNMNSTNSEYAIL